LIEVVTKAGLTKLIEVVTDHLYLLSQTRFSDHLYQVTVKPALVTTSIKLVKPVLVTTSINLQSNLH
jgi:hypothetical protein